MTVFYCITLLITPAIMLIIGTVWKNSPPKTINFIYGYRTKASMKSQEAWDFAHNSIACIWRKAGIYLALTAGIPLLLQGIKDDTRELVFLAVIAIQVLVLFLSILTTERELRKKFGENDNSKN